MSDVEQFYYKVRDKLEGERHWYQLAPQEQMMFIQAINIIKNICEVTNEQSV